MTFLLIYDRGTVSNVRSLNRPLFRKHAFLKENYFQCYFLEEFETNFFLKKNQICILKMFLKILS